MSAPVRRGFASDNNATIHPEVLAAIAAANVGHAGGYGHDPHTEALERRLEEVFGPGCRSFLVFNGTGANVVALRAACRRWEAVICSTVSHLNVDEGGAPEAVAGVKLLGVQAPQGKLTAEGVRARIERLGDEHAVQPRLVSISQSTELGTVYTAEEVGALADLAHEHGLLLHMDGARLANAAVSLGAGLADVSIRAGVDILSLGGTKNGLLGGEAVIFARPETAAGVPWLRKQSLQLASKMRYVAVQFDALLRDELWSRSAGQANAMAARLAGQVRDLPGVQITQPVQANAVFAILPPAVTAELQREFPFYVWDERTGEVRWMCSWDTTEEDVDAFVAALRRLVEPARD